MPQQSLPKSREQALALGSRYYFNGRRCPHGHVSKYRTADYACYECYLGKQRSRKRIKCDQAPNTLCRHTRRHLLEPRYLTKHSKLLGCSGATLRAHIESLFTPGMSWENYGRGADQWQMDHKTPLSKFDLRNRAAAAAAAHYTNVQPVWSGDNARKSWVM